MPSPLTHIMLVNNECDEIENVFKDKTRAAELDNILANNSAELCFGSISPDITYFSEKVATRMLSDITQNDIHFIADCIHLEDANLLLEAGFQKLLGLKGQIDQATFDSLFTFLCGYVAHVVADGVVHPYVRDKVGDYTTDENKFNHRLLEMRLDVLLCKEVYQLNLNDVEIQDNLEGLNFEQPLFTFISDIINSAYSSFIEKKLGRDITTKDIKNCYYASQRAFEVSSHREKIPLLWFKHLTEKNAINHEDFDSGKIDIPAIRKLTTPKEFKKKPLPNNFMKKSEVDFVYDVIPRFAEIYLPILESLYNHIYYGEGLDLSNLPPFSLDDGRLLSNKEGKAFYWG